MQKKLTLRFETEGLTATRQLTTGGKQHFKHFDAQNMLMLESCATIIDTWHRCFKTQQKPRLELELINSISLFSVSQIIKKNYIMKI